MPDLYPLRFEPIYRQYLWGGRRLASKLGKVLGDGENYAESWEIVDRRSDQSVVVAGPLAGATLSELGAGHGTALFGHDGPRKPFPLLFKFLDAHRNLSVQVHPNDEEAACLDPPDLGKTEAWVIVDAEPGSVIYAGLKRGIGQADVERAARQGNMESCLHCFEPRVGDCVFIPAGTVHALGAGLLVAEIQQASDTTFRLSDWNRIGPDGRPRELHVEQALDVIDFESGPVRPRLPRSTERPGVERLVACDKFVVDRCRTADPIELGGSGGFHIIAVLAGEVRLRDDPSGALLALGQTALLPACCGACEAVPTAEATLLDIHLPPRAPREGSS